MSTSHLQTLLLLFLIQDHRRSIFAFRCQADCGMVKMRCCGGADGRHGESFRTRTPEVVTPKGVHTTTQLGASLRCCIYNTRRVQVCTCPCIWAAGRNLYSTVAPKYSFPRAKLMSVRRIIQPEAQKIPKSQNSIVWNKMPFSQVAISDTTWIKLNWMQLWPANPQRRREELSCYSTPRPNGVHPC